MHAWGYVLIGRNCKRQYEYDDDQCENTHWAEEEEPDSPTRAKALPTPGRFEPSWFRMKGAGASASASASTRARSPAQQSWRDLRIATPSSGAASDARTITSVRHARPSS